MSGNIAQMFKKENIPYEEFVSTSGSSSLEPSMLSDSATMKDNEQPKNAEENGSEDISDPFVLKDIPPELKDQLIKSLKQNNMETTADTDLRPKTPELTAKERNVPNDVQGASNFTDNLVDLKPTLPERNHITEALENNLEMFTALGGMDRASSADSTSLSSRQSSRILRSLSNDDDVSSQSSSVRSHQRHGSTGLGTGEHKNWVQFDEPQKQSRPHIPIQYTGSSVRSDLTSERSWVTDDRQSDIAEPQDSYSHDYIRLDSTKSPLPDDWVTFDDVSQPVRPPSRPTQPEPITPSTPSAHDHGTLTPDTPKAVPSHWVAFDEDEKRSTILRSPVHQSLTGRTTSSPGSRELSLTSTSEEGTPTKVLPERNIPSRGNPFAEELQKQKDTAILEHTAVNLNRPTSPYNPFTGGEDVTSPIRKNWETFDDQSSVGNPFKVAKVEGTRMTQQTQQTQQTQVIQKTHNTQTQITQPDQKQETYSVVTNTSGDVTQSYNPPQMTSGSKDNNWENFIALHMGQQKSKNVDSDIRTVTNTHQPLQRKATLLQQSHGASSSRADKPVSSLEDPLGVDFVDEYPLPVVDLGVGWNLLLRHPGKKKMAGSRSWKLVYVKITNENVIQLYNSETSREPFSEIQLQSNYEITEPSLQSYTDMGKIHKVYLFYMSYVEKRKYSAKIPFEKMKKSDELIKLASTSIDDLKEFTRCVNDSLMSLQVCRERGVQYHSECVIIDVVDRFRALIGNEGVVEKQSVSVSISCIAFVSGMPDCALGLNDIQRKDVEVTARQDIIPSKAERWIKLEDVKFHHCVDKEAFIDSHLIKFTPLEACKFELIRYKVKSHLEQALPLMVRVQLGGEGNHLQLRADVIVRGSHERITASHSACCDIVIRIPIPQTWLHIFRKKKKFGQSSVKSATKKSGKIKKGSNHSSLLETSIGIAKYEHAFGAIVWRIPKLPEKNQVGNSNHIFMCHVSMQSNQHIPKTFHHQARVEFTMLHSTASKTIVRSLSTTNERAPEKRVRYCAHYEYFVNIENHYVALGEDSSTENPSGCSLQ